VARLGLLRVLSLAGHPGAAQAPHYGPVVRWPEAVGFAALTGITFATDGRIRTAMQGHNTRFRNSAARIGNAFGNARYVYPALLLATLAGSVIGSDDIYGVSWRALKSPALAGGATVVLKSLIGRRRPDVSPDNPYQFSPLSFAFNSLPSGHTTVAFSLATSLAMETRSVLPDIALFGLAATTGFARLHVNKHWASDTVVGAGVGILAARLVRRYDRSGGAGALSLAWNFTF
jgi:membrane-associated phospholipid phosphatase